MYKCGDNEKCVDLGFKGGGSGRVLYLIKSIYEKSGISLGMCPAIERRRYNVTTTPIGWAHTRADPWVY